MSYPTAQGDVTEVYVQEGPMLRLDHGTYGGSQATWHKAPMQKCGAVASDAAPAPVASAQSAADLRAKAAAAEAEAQRLEAQAGGAPASGSATSDSVETGTRPFGTGEGHLSTGQRYDTLDFDAVAGQTYQVTYVAHGYNPVLIVVDGAGNKRDEVDGQQIDAFIIKRIHPDTSGRWHVFLSSMTTDAHGTYEARMQQLPN